MYSAVYLHGLRDGQMDKQTIVHSLYYYYHTQPVQLHGWVDGWTDG